MLPLLLCILFAPAELPTNLVVNGGFERTRGWQLGNARLSAGEEGRCLRLDGGGASQELPAPQAPQVAVAVDLRCAGVQPRGGAGYAYAAVYQLDATGELVSFRDFIQLTGDHPWQRHSAVLEVDPRAATLSLRCGLFQATGWLEVDNWTLVTGDQPAAWDAVRQPGGGSASRRVAILNLPDLPVEGAGSSPATLAKLLRGAGFEVELLDDRAWADPLVLQPPKYGLAVVPTGASFPAAARENWRRYLRAGGSFISTGGYAFENLLVRDGTRWVDESVKLERDLTAACSAENSLLPDGGFEQAAAWPVGGESIDGQWHARSEHPQRVQTEPLTGKACAEVDVPADRGEGEDGLWLELPAARGVYRVMAAVRSEGITGRGFAYAALYQYGADGKLLAWRDFAQVRGTTDWQRYTFDFSPEPGVQRIHLKLGLYRAVGRAWFDDCRLSRITGLQPSPLNSSTGEPRDGLVIGPERIGVFDPSAPLKRVTRLRAAAGQRVVDAKVDLTGDFTGWQATGVLGQNNARWIPLLEAVDRYGRPRGAAAAMMINTGGYYGGSTWAYFGVDNQDLFAKPDSSASSALVGAAKFIGDGVYLRDLRCEKRYLPAQRSLQVTVGIEARDELPAGLHVRFVVDGENGSPGTEVPAKLPLAEVTEDLPAVDLPPGTHQISATLYLDGHAIDTLTTGLIVADPAEIKHGPALRFRDNDFTLHDRPLFLFGADTYSYTYKSAHENPWTWHQDHLAARDFGLNLYENLQYNNPDHKLTEDDWENFLGMAQSTYDTGLVFMPGMLIGHNVVVDDSELQRQRDHCADYAEHLHDLPLLLYYINGDYKLRPDENVAVTTKLWDRFLRDRYGSLEALRDAWGADRVQLKDGLIVWPPQGNLQWDDRTQVDAWEFKLWLMRRWNQANVQAVREHDQVHPITSEYYSTPFGGIDQRLTIDGQDVSNIGYFDEPEQDLDRLPLRLSWNDLRARGKGVSLGEYGVKTHPAWAPENGGRGYHIQRTEAQQQQLFMTVAAYTLGLGGSKVQTWCLRDAQDRVFPWGIFYPNQLIPKDVAYVHRNLSLLWRTMTPADEAPQVTVCLPSRMRIGNGEVQGRDLGYRAFEGLHELHVPFNVIDDTALDEIPAATKALLLPCAAAIADDQLDRLGSWVAAGGHLLLTGDPGWDELRRPADPARYERLCGVKLLEHLAPPPQRGPEAVVAGQTWQPAVRVAADPSEVVIGTPELPVLCRHKLGRGEVLYLTDPLELAPVGQPLATQALVYRRWLISAKVGALRVAPDSPELRVASRQTAHGRFWLLFDHRAVDDHGEATLDGRIHLGYRPRWPAVMQVGDDGTARMVISDSTAKLGDTTLWSGQGLHGLTSLVGDDLLYTRRLLLTPFDTGTITLPPRPGKWVALVGDVRDGKWVVYERLALAETPSITIDEDRRLCLILVVPLGEEEDAGLLVERWLNRPWTMAGS